MKNKNKIPRTGHPSSRDVAQLAGVSQSTVSRAYNPEYHLAADLKRRVFKAASTLGYRPNAIARSLLSNRTNLVGIVTSVLSSPFISEALSLFIAKLQEKNYQSLVFSPRVDDDIDTVIDRVLQYRVDLLLIFGAKKTTKMANVCVNNGTPVVLFNRYISGTNTSAVCCNDFQCGQIAAQELFDCGYRHMAYIAGDLDVSTNIDRRAGFEQKLRECGISTCITVQGGYSYESGLEAAKDLLEKSPDIDCCFCANDIMAIGVLDYVRFMAGRRVPEDFGVIGFDDISMANQLSYRLTTIRQPLDQMVDATISTIEETLQKPQQSPILRVIEGELIRRGTTKRCDR